VLSSLKRRIRRLRTESRALYLAARHPDTPWYAKFLIATVAAYALSPIDLVPDFVPIVGYLDDLVLVPIGIALAIRMVPPSVLMECRALAQDGAGCPGFAVKPSEAVQGCSCDKGPWSGDRSAPPT
jgi:uncharacterized membrane protein YkvA (DUF1232 family)